MRRSGMARQDGIRAYKKKNPSAQATYAQVSLIVSGSKKAEAK
jgi:hypothetical protein